MRVGVLTGGGDCPGLNAVIRAVVRKGVFHYQDEFIGFLEGWRGLLEDKTMPLDLSSVGGILPRGGTILRTSRTNPGRPLSPCGRPRRRASLLARRARQSFSDERGRRRPARHDAGSRVHSPGSRAQPGLAAAHRCGTCRGIHGRGRVDLAGTDFTFGFDTAVNVATGAIDRVHTTAEAHNRVMVVEVMGRDSGWIALYSGIAGGADVILIPEQPFDIDKVAELIKLRHSRGRYFSIVVAAEGAKFATDVELHDGAPIVQDVGKDEFGHLRLGGIGNILAHEIEKRTGFETRSVVLGHIQRGGTPSAFDRMLATRYGIGAIDMVHRGEFGNMAALRGNKIVSVPLAEAIASNRKVDQEIIDVAVGILDKLTDEKEVLAK